MCFHIAQSYEFFFGNSWSSMRCMSHTVHFIFTRKRKLCKFDLSMFENMHGTAAGMPWRTMECAGCSRQQFEVILCYRKCARVHTNTSDYKEEEDFSVVTWKQNRFDMHSPVLHGNVFWNALAFAHQTIKCQRKN